MLRELPQELSLALPARPASVTEARHRVDEYARSLGMDHAADVALAVSEAVSNAVAHAYRMREPGTIELRAELLVPETLLVVVADDGDGMMPNPRSTGIGLGLPLMASLCVGLEIEPSPPHGTRVSMRFPLTHASVQTSLQPA